MSFPYPIGFMLHGVSNLYIQRDTCVLLVVALWLDEMYFRGGKTWIYAHMHASLNEDVTSRDNPVLTIMGRFGRTKH